MMRTEPIGSPAPLGLGVLRAHMWLTIVVWDCPANVNGDRLGDSAGQLGLKSLYWVYCNGEAVSEDGRDCRLFRRPGRTSGRRSRGSPHGAEIL